MAGNHPRLSQQDLEAAIIEAARCAGSRRHTLEPIPTPVGAPRPTFGSLLAQRCVHCGTVRYDKVSRLTGQTLSTPVYDRPPWYEQALEQRQEPSWWRARFWDTLGPEFFLDSAVAAAAPAVADEVATKRRRRRAG